MAITPWCYTSPAVYAIVFFVMMVVFAIFNLIFSIYALYKMYQSSNTIASGIKILYIIITVLFGFGGLAYIGHLTIGFTCSGYEIWTSCGLTGLNSYSVGLTFLYLLYLIRLWMIFHADILSKLSTVVFIIGGIGFLGQLVIHPFTTYYFEVNPPYNWPKATTCMSVFTIANAVFSLFLLYLFWTKVKVLGKRNNMNTKIILTPAITYAFCCFISVMSSELVNAISLYRAFIDHDRHYIFLSLHYVLIEMDESINLICLFLQFNFGKKYYFKYLGSMHSFVELKVVSKMSTTIGNTTSTTANATQENTEKTTDTVTDISIPTNTDTNGTVMKTVTRTNGTISTQITVIDNDIVSKKDVSIV
eukprot:41494_1